MNRIRWLYEAWQLRLEDTAKGETIRKLGTEAFKVLQRLIVSVLGCNLEPIAEPNPANPMDPEQISYRLPREDEFTPLIFAIARPEYIENAMKKLQQVGEQHDISVEQDTAAGMAYTEEDLEFFDSIEVNIKKSTWKDPKTQEQLRRLVVLEENAPENAPVAAPPSPATSPASKRSRAFQLDEDPDED